MSLLVGDLFPMLVPSEHTPMAGLPYLGPRVNRMLIRLGRSPRLDRITSAEGFRAYRRRLGLPADGWNVIDGRLSPDRNLGLVPSAYLEPQPDWPSGASSWSPTPPSRRGSRPWPDSPPRAPLRLLAPLLGRARAIVHSGAHGTNALALLAGVPSVVVPCLFDQQFHARRQQELGTGQWVRRPRQLGAAVRAVIGDRRYAERAEHFGHRVRAEDGTTAVADEAEAMLGGG